MLAYYTKHYTKLFYVNLENNTLIEHKKFVSTVKFPLLINNEYILIHTLDYLEIKSIEDNYYSKKIKMKMPWSIIYRVFNTNILITFDNVIKIFDIELNILDEIILEDCITINCLVVLDETKILIYDNNNILNIYDFKLKKTTNINCIDTSDINFLFSENNKIILIFEDCIKTIDHNTFTINTLHFDIFSYISYVKLSGGNIFIYRNQKFEMYDIETLSLIKIFEIDLSTIPLKPHSLFTFLPIGNDIFFVMGKCIYKYNILLSTLELIIEDNYDIMYELQYCENKNTILW